MYRRTFLKRIGGVSLLIGSNTFPLKAFNRPKAQKLTILHTNDVHSRIEPFPMDDSRYPGLGGFARRVALIKKIRKEEPNVLLFDSGDIFQGTPYFNYFGGELEFKLMTEMGYDAATIGNHDFDAGIEGLHKQLPHAGFSLISSNYNFSDTIMKGHTKPYQVFQKGELRIGILGLGIKLEGLVSEKLYADTRYLDPIEKANKIAAILKHDEHCDLVVCLSHLGLEYKTEEVSDVLLAKNSRYIDLILGGHTHTLMDKPKIVENLDKEKVIINQVGYGGVVLGRLDFYFEPHSRKKCSNCKSLLIRNRP